jgi:cytosine/uracil/thiamine/allantoin permease
MIAVPQRLLAVLAGAAAFILAVSVDLLGYENFLLLIGGVFVSLFGVLLADYVVVNRQRYDPAELYAEGGAYWYWNGVNLAGMLAWAAGFVVYTVCAQPPALVDHFSWIANAPDALTKYGGTIPSFVVSLGAYLALRPILARNAAVPEGAVAG